MGAETVAGTPCGRPGSALQIDATSNAVIPSRAIISTDPPYYDNVPYADLSDFFYFGYANHSRKSIQRFSAHCWYRKHKNLSRNRLGMGIDRARQFFEEGMVNAFSRVRTLQHTEYPLTVYYAFKQSETEEGLDSSMASASSGWETMLEGLREAGYSISGTWPMRTERSGRLRDTGSNALASSIVLVCRLRPADAPMTTRREF